MRVCVHELMLSCGGCFRSCDDEVEVVVHARPQAQGKDKKEGSKLLAERSRHDDDVGLSCKHLCM